MNKTLIFTILLLAINCAQQNTVLQADDSDIDPDLSKVFTLEYDYAAQKGVKPQLSKFSIFFNGHKYHTITPTDYQVHHDSITMIALSNSQNVFTIKGIGKGFRAGVTVANFQLKRKGKCSIEDVLVNGYFNTPAKIKNHSQRFSSLEGWSFQRQLELADGTKYNSNWDNDVRVAHLVGHTQISQSFFLDQHNQVSTNALLNL